MNRIVVLDLETTGLSPFMGDRVIELGALAVEGGVVRDTFHTLIRVRRKIPWQATRIHGITDEMLVGQTLPEDVYPAFKNFISDSLLVAHNARFDLSFLRHEFGRLDLGLTNRSACTLQLARKRFPQLTNHRLETVARHLLGDLPMEGRMHRALDDALLTAKVWMAMKGG